MRKIKKILVVLLSLIIMPQVNAASGSIQVNSSSTVVQGNRVTVTVTLSSGTAIGSWQMDLNYDKNFLQLVSSNAEGGGTRMVNSSASGTKSKTYTFAFKALKTGSTRISVSSYLAYAFSDLSEISLTSSSKSIRIMTQAELEATYSKDNNLKSLSVEGYELDKEFNKDTLEYTVNVPTGTTNVKINAIENDPKSSISGAGEVTVTEGVNTFPIIVTAQNGSSKTYTLIINVEDLSPIIVKVNDIDYTLVKTASLLTGPSTFITSTTTIDNFEIPTFVNNASNITLVGLKDALGTIKLFRYENGEYILYNELTTKNYLLIPSNFTKELDLIKTTITINEEEFEAYKYSENSKYYIISAQNLEDGKTNMYVYDKEANTAQIFDETYINETNETIKNYTYVIITFAGALVVTLIIIIILLISLRKKHKKIKKFIKKQEAKIEATMKLNDVVSEVKKVTTENKNNESKPKKKQKNISQTEEKIEVKEIKVSEEPKNEINNQDEVYDLFGDDKKKKKQK